MKKILAIGAGLAAVALLAVALKNGWVHTDTTPLPQETATRLAALRSALADEAAKSEKEASDSDQHAEQLDQLKSIVASSRNALVPVLVDGVKLQNGLTKALALTNAAEFLELELVADGLIAREGYSALDARLQKVEHTFSKTDEVCNTLTRQDKLISQQMAAIQADSDTEPTFASVLRAAVNLHSISADQTMEKYQEGVRKATTALRESVDKSLR